MELPETRYARRSDGVNIAYQVLGNAERTLVWCQGLGSHLDLRWTEPNMARFFRALASFTRLVLYDKAGTGLSDPIAHVPTVEERAEDIRAVLDAVGAERAAIFGESEGGPSAMVFRHSSGAYGRAAAVRHLDQGTAHGRGAGGDRSDPGDGG